VAPLSVDPTALSAAGVSLAAVGDGYTTAMTTLAAAFSANTGQDAAGVVFGRQYVNTGRDLLKAVTAGINALRTTGYGIQMSAVNYSRAEAASDISMRAQALPTPPCPAPVTSAAPPVPTGGGVAQPMLWAVVEFLVGDLWPNGDPTALRTAGAAWKTFGSALYHVSIDTAGPYNTVGAQQIPEAELIKAPIRDIGSMMSSLGGACQTLGNGLINYANDVEHAQQAIRDLLNKLGSIGGIVGTFFEFVKGHGDDELDEIVDAFWSTWIARYGIPRTITTDRGSQFESAMFDSFTKFLGCSRSRTTAYHPAANGIIERWPCAQGSHNVPRWQAMD